MWVESKLTTSFSVTVAQNSDMHKYLRDELVNNEFSDSKSIYAAIKSAHDIWWAPYKREVLFEIERRWDAIGELDLKKVADELLEEWEERYWLGLEVSIWESMSSYPQDLHIETLNSLTEFWDRARQAMWWPRI